MPLDSPQREAPGLARDKISRSEILEAGGVGTFKPIENTQLIEIAKRPKRWKPQNSRQLERNWNAGFSLFRLGFLPQMECAGCGLASEYPSPGDAESIWLMHGLLRQTDAPEQLLESGF